MAEAKGLRFLGGEDKCYLRYALAVLAVHRDLGTAVRVHLDLVFRHGVGGSAVGAVKVLLPREPRRLASLLARE